MLYLFLLFVVKGEEKNAFDQMKERLGLTREQMNQFADIPQTLIQEVVQQLTSSMNPELMSEMVKNFNHMKGLMGNEQNIPDMATIMQSLNDVNTEKPSEF